MEFERAACRPFLIFRIQPESCGNEIRLAIYDRGSGTVSPALTLYRLRSLFAIRVLEPDLGSCQVKDVPVGRNKTAQADAGNIDKGLTLKPSRKGIGL